MCPSSVRLESDTPPPTFTHEQTQHRHVIRQQLSTIFFQSFLALLCFLKNILIKLFDSKVITYRNKLY